MKLNQLQKLLLRRLATGEYAEKRGGYYCVGKYQFNPNTVVRQLLEAGYVYHETVEIDDQNVERVAITDAGFEAVSK